jgi:hypothetical protein
LIGKSSGFITGEGEWAPTLVPSLLF